MDRGDALLLRKEMEKVDGSSLNVDVNEFKWWQENFPEVPDRIIRKLVSSVEPWDPAALPWNRHQRRAHQKKGVALHLFCGPNVRKWKDCEVGGWSGFVSTLALVRSTICTDLQCGATCGGWPTRASSS